MSNHKTIAITAFGLSLLLLAGGLYYKDHRPTDASIKNASLKPSMEKIKRTMKLGIGLEADLIIDSDIEIQKSFVARLIVERKSARHNYVYELRLPENIELLNGEKSAQLEFVDNKSEVELQLQHHSFTNERIGVVLRSSGGGKQRVSVSTLNYFDDQAAYHALHERSQNYLEENPEAIEAQSRATASAHDHSHDH